LRLLGNDTDNFDQLDLGLSRLFKAIQSSYKHINAVEGQELDLVNLPSVLDPFFELKENGHSLPNSLLQLKNALADYVDRLDTRSLKTRADFSSHYGHITLPQVPQEHQLTYESDDLTNRVSNALYQDFRSSRTDQLSTEASTLSVFNTSRQSRRKKPSTEQDKKSYLRTITDMKMVADMPDTLLRQNAITEGFTDLRAGKVQALLASLEQTLSESDTAIIATEFTKEVVPYLQNALASHFGERVTVRAYNGESSAADKRTTLAWFKGTVPIAASTDANSTDPNSSHGNVAASNKPGVEVASGSEQKQSGDLGAKKVLLLASKAGQRGLNLQNNRHIYLFDGLFNPESEAQVIGRSNRIGGLGAVKVFRFDGLPIEQITSVIRQRKAMLIDNVWRMDPNNFVKEILHHVITENEKSITPEAGPLFKDSIKSLLAEETRPWLRGEVRGEARGEARRKAHAPAGPEGQLPVAPVAPEDPFAPLPLPAPDFDPLPVVDPFDDGGLFDGIDDSFLDDFIQGL
jgi:hypothetical protein